MLARTNAILPIASAADLSGKEGHFVTAAGALAGANAAAFGVITEGYPAGVTSSIAVCAGAHVVKVKLATNATRGAFVGSDVNGKATTAATTHCAQILEDGSADELVEAVTFKPVAA